MILYEDQFWARRKPYHNRFSLSSNDRCPLLLLRSATVHTAHSCSSQHLKMEASLLPTDASRSRRSGGPSTHMTIFMAIIAVFTMMSFALNMLHHEDRDQGMPGMLIHPILSKANIPNIKQAKAAAASKPIVKENNDLLVVDSASLEVVGSQHTLAGLSCAAYGGPSDEIATKEMVYWADIPSDAAYVSPFKKNNDAKGLPTQYMTFEPDGGGWNNIRMAMETVVVMAHAMGRTLVMPPAQGMYLLRKDRGKQNTDFSFADFFHLESLSQEHAGLDIISAEEFLNRVAMTGQLRNKTTGEVAFPPGNVTNWDGKDIKIYKEYMRDVIYTPLWKPERCLAAFPASGDPKDERDLNNMLSELMMGERHANKTQFVDNPTPVDAEPMDRMREVLDGRSELCIYDEEMQKQQVLHFMCYHKMRVRLLTHFYTFLFFEDWRQQLWEHRFVRDHLRYLDELQCAAARVVTELRNIAKNEGNSDGLFDTFHIRRGDFQYKETRLEADQLYEKSKDLMPEGSVLYIATDERKKDFFDIFKKHYKVYFLDDFKHLVSIFVYPCLSYYFPSIAFLTLLIVCWPEHKLLRNA